MSCKLIDQRCGIRLAVAMTLSCVMPSSGFRGSGDGLVAVVFM